MQGKNIIPELPKWSHCLVWLFSRF